MSDQPAMNVSYDPAFTEVNGSIRIDRRSRATGLSHIVAGFAEWTDATPSEPWVLPYEEAVFVLEGQLTIEAGDLKVVGRPGELITVEKGTETVSYATPGTKVFYASYPGNWKELIEE